MDLETYVTECLARGDAPIKKQYVRQIAKIEKQEAVATPVTVDSSDLPVSAPQGDAEVGDKRPADDSRKPHDDDKKKRRGQNKNFERKDIQEQINKSKADQLCLRFASSDSCEFGHRCTNSHDAETFLANKKPDLGEDCPNFTEHGVCPFGLNCRFGSKHIKDGRNVNRAGEPVTDEMVKAVRGEGGDGISHQTKVDMRRRTYNFGRADALVKRVHEAGSDRAKVDDTNFEPRAQKEARILAEGGSVLDNPSDTPLNIALRELNKSMLGEGCVVQSWQEEKEARHAKFDLRGKLVLAPLTTVGNLPYRRLCVDMGVDATFSEMALATSILESKPSELALLKRHPSEKLFGVQIAGGFPDTMTRVAQFVDENVDCDFIDINSGCPIEGMNGRGAGCALMSKPHHMEKMLRCMSAVSRKPVTIKIRMAYMERDMLARSYMQRVEEWGAAAVTIHGRTAKQRYTKAANWEYIASCKPELKRIPLVGDGDVMSWAECEEKFRLGMSDAVMVGRGALIKPWVFSEIKQQRDWDISSAERFDLIKKFASYGLEHWGSDNKGVETTRRFLLESLSFLHRYIPVGLLEQLPQKIHWRPPPLVGRDDMETRLASSSVQDWMWIAERVLGPAPEGFTFTPKHKSNSYATSVDEYYADVAAQQAAYAATHDGKEAIRAAAEAAAAQQEGQELQDA